jgi:PilZ domain
MVARMERSTRKSTVAETMELRAHPRFFVSAEVQISTGVGRQRALLKDISLSGARVLVGHPVGDWGDVARVELPAEGALLDLEGAIVRTEPREDGYSVAVRFNPVAPMLRTRLESLIRELDQQARAQRPDRS